MKTKGGQIRVSEETWKRLKALAKKDKRTMSNTIAILLDKECNNVKP